jgi:murein DD-endopeptidase MepM/ murein hydrolase activator NlpD
VATTVATTLTAGGIVALLWNHTGATADTPDQRAAAAHPVRQEGTVTRLVTDRSTLPGRTIRSVPSTAASSPARRAAPRAGTARRTSARSAKPAATAKSGSATRSKSGATPSKKTATEKSASTAAKAAAPAAKWVRPGTGTISSCFCERWGTFHWGVDLAAPYGAPIYAAGDGVVLRAGPATGFGQAVYIQHANGDTTVYGHMEKILVTDGEHVHAGQEIALVGAEGEATGPHLHFEVHQGSEYGTKIDPGPWLAARGVHL